MGLYDRVVDAGCSLDWITPAIAFVRDATSGGYADFGIAADAGWNRQDVSQLLNSRGVPVWGLLYSSDAIIFTVPKAQARWALYLLELAGAPLLYVPKGLGQASQRLQPAPPIPDVVTTQEPLLRRVFDLVAGL